MEFFKDRNKWGLVLGGVFLLAIISTISALLHFKNALLSTNDNTALSLLYGGLAAATLTGSAALWVMYHARREIMIYREKERENYALSPSLLTVRAGVDCGLTSACPPQGRNGHTNHQHKKITESINYAKRIQGAILPNPRVIDRVLPDSFILYKPRDIVSGDFPWFAQVKNEIFMAAVDCTGHGVPGALLSLVGYFLLNDIVRGRRVTDPGRILDLLNEGVSTTLRHDEDAGMKDGMDISLCKINLEAKEVIYAGAHRPLYVVKNGVLDEIKGDRFPIGGGIFKNQTNFSSNKVKLEHSDSIYFCSDGFCDQFGGPKGRKFGTKHLRTIISKVHTVPMKEAMAIFDDEWKTWKGSQKQTDDVLLIGIRF